MRDTARTRLGPFAGHGAVFRVETADPVLAELLSRLLGPLAVADPETGDAAMLAAGDAAVLAVDAPTDDTPGAIHLHGRRVATSASRGQLLTLLLQQINRLVLEASTDWLLLHAAAAARDGAAVLLPADMEAGKTTLVAGLVGRGWHYLSDESPALADDDVPAVLAYPKPLSVDPGSWDVLPELRPTGPAANAGWFDEQWQVVPARVVGRAPLGMVVFPKYEAGVTTVLTPLTPGEAVERAVPCTFVTDRAHIATDTVRRLAKVVARVPAYALAVGDLGEACDLIEEAWTEHGVGEEVRGGSDGAVAADLASAQAVLRLEQRLLDVTGWFADAGIESLVLKGAALAHLDWPSPGDRAYGDIDLLLHGDDLAAAEQLLAERGYERRQPGLRPAFDRRFAKSVTMVAPDTIELDLHRTLAFGTFGLLVDLDQVWSTAVAFEIAGQRLRAPDREHRLLHACLHAVLDERAPDRSVRDVAVLLEHAQVDHDLVAQRARDWQVEAVIARAIALAEERFGAAPAGPTVARFADHVARRRDVRAIDAYARRAGRHLAIVLATLPYLDSWRDRARWLWSSLVPSRAFLRGYGGLLGWWRRGLRAVLRLWRDTR